MERKRFLCLSTGILTTPLFSQAMRFIQDDRLKNWAGNFEFSTSNVYYPKSTADASRLIKNKRSLRALGTRHCFNRVADSSANLVCSSTMNRFISLDVKNRRVIVEGGIKYGELSPILDQKGYALHNLASLPHISIAGSISTGTHGSGIHNGNLSTAVEALELIRADGSIRHISREKDGEGFLASVVGLGALGWISNVELKVIPRFDMRQFVFENLAISRLGDDFDKIMAAGYSVSLFTDWNGPEINEVWIKSRLDEHPDYSKQPEFFGAPAAAKNMHPIASLSAENCTPQMGVPGPWYERLPHFKMGFTPSSGKELQSEYFVPHRHAVEAILAMQRMGSKISPLLQITEIRSIAADHLWLSPCFNRDSITIHFTWKPEWDKVREILPIIEKELAPFHPRPHWGKLFTLSPQVLASRYEKMEDFKKMVTAEDPTGKFRNDFMNQYIFRT